MCMWGKKVRKIETETLLQMKKKDTILQYAIESMGLVYLHTFR